MTNLLLTLLVLAGPGSLSLEDCIREALRNHPDVGLSLKDVEQAEARKLGTRAGYLPRLDLRIQDGYTFWGQQEYIYGSGGGERLRYIQPADGDDSHSMSLSLSQNIFDGGKWWKRISRANRDIHASRLGVRISREDVALQTIVTYYELLKAQKQLEVLQQGLESSTAQLRLSEERHRLGAASKVDVAKARVSVGEDRIAIEHQRRSIDAAVVQLNLAMGRPPNQTVVLAAGEPEGEIAWKTDQAAVPDGHVVLQRFDAAREVADLDVAIAEGDWWPTVWGAISYSRQDPEFYKVWSRFDELYRLTFMLGISVPIFDGFQTSSAVEQAEVIAERLKLEKESARQDLQASLSRALSDLQRLESVSKIEADNIIAAEQQLELARESYDVGQGTALELRDAQLAVTRAKLSSVQTLYELRIAWARYHQARGDLLATYVPGEQP